MYRLISLSAMLVIAADASQYYYAPLGPWGLESTIINANEVRKTDTDTKKVITTSRKAFVGKKKAADKKVEEVKSTVDDDLEQGAGFGLRWRSPVGPVRIDLANAISTDDKNWRLHVSIGPDL